MKTIAIDEPENAILRCVCNNRGARWLVYKCMCVSVCVSVAQRMTPRSFQPGKLIGRGFPPRLLMLTLRKTRGVPRVSRSREIYRPLPLCSGRGANVAQTQARRHSHPSRPISWFSLVFFFFFCHKIFVTLSPFANSLLLQNPNDFTIQLQIHKQLKM